MGLTQQALLIVGQKVFVGLLSMYSGLDAKKTPVKRKDNTLKITP